MAQKVIIKGVEYNYRLDLAAMLHYEDLFGKMPEDLRSSRRTTMVMHYACLVYDENFAMTFDEFTRAIDTLETLEALKAAGDAEQKRWNVKNNLNAEATEGGDVKKK